MEEKQLLDGCLAGKRSAQKQLYERYAPNMFGVCLRYAAHRDMAEDMLQEGFIRVFTKLDSYRSEGSLEGWIRRIMVNTALEMLRKTDVLKYSVDIEMVQEYDSAQTDGFGKLSTAELLRNIQEMPAGFRAVFNLFAIEGYSHREIADMLQIAEGTSKSQYARSRAWLQKRIKPQLE
ncbi:MAG: RNA polymerase sigma factor [Bacteroidales bacterium]|nr:RNA polymerase sigma factor [Bacteroidales bacterium]MDZ4203626.1 RNA polymerase sigma factor [Bacteroidales bacterium]